MRLTHHQLAERPATGARELFAALLVAFALGSFPSPLLAAVPQVISYQCWISSDGVRFTGVGRFKFALLDASGTTTYWSNDGSSSGGGQPTTSVALAVSKGLCSVLLGDTSLANMTAISATVFAHAEVRLRVWFDDGTRGWQQLAPDERIAAVGYAMMAGTAETVIDGAITGAKFASGAILANLNAGGASGVPPGGVVFSFADDPSSGSAETAGQNITAPLGGLNSRIWKPSQPVTGSPPSARHGHTAVWTGGEMIVWGGNNDGNWFNDGGRYQPDGWVDWNGGTGQAPTARVFHSAVWTGSEMIVWGGQDRNVNCSLPTDLFTYNPASNIWTKFPSANAPEGRTYHSAVWTGTEFIVWGGISGAGGGAAATATIASGTVSAVTVTNPGCGYTSAPTVAFSGGGGSGAAATATIASGTVSAVTVTNPGSGFTATPTVSFSGGGGNSLNSGGRYNPTTNKWTTIPNTLSNTPTPRRAHTAVWTGSEMIVWGGFDPPNWLNDGARYNLATGSWGLLPASGAPAHRSGHSAVWTGSEMIIWGGQSGSSHVPDLRRYNPSTNSWTTSTAVDAAPVGRTYHSTVWTGSPTNPNGEMIIWGGFGAEGYLNSGGRYDPSKDRWMGIPSYGAPAPRWAHSAVWISSPTDPDGEMIIWGGEGYNGYQNDLWRLVPAWGINF